MLINYRAIDKSKLVTFEDVAKQCDQSLEDLECLRIRSEAGGLQLVIWNAHRTEIVATADRESEVRWLICAEMQQNWSLQCHSGQTPKVSLEGFTVIRLSRLASCICAILEKHLEA